LRAWLAVFEKMPHTDLGRQALADASVPPYDASLAFMKALSPHIQISTRYEHELEPMVTSLLQMAADQLCFWLRDGALYEPTLPLGSLLSGVDISADLPLSLLKPTLPAICIVPPWQQRHHCADKHAISVYSHVAPPNQAPAQRSLTIKAYEVLPALGLAVDELTLPVKDENAPLSEALGKALRATMDRPRPAGLEGADWAKLEQDWQKILDYVVKVLLYAQIEGTQIHHQTPYTEAPKEFPGLGRKKLEARIAEIDKLYDRYLIGPMTALDWAGEHADQLGAGGQLSPHWRRGHLRLQVHGPAQSMRKVMFIKPTLVRSDRLADASASVN
jgi:hypothetical protein